MIQVQKNEDVYRLMVETILDCAIFMLDANGRVFTWNAGAERIKGYK
ncbi:MAG TPA: PAS domain-containing protein, partial [Hyphomicrobium sp.]